MISVVSPAKSLDFDNKAPVSDFSLPLFHKESQMIVNVLKELFTRRFIQIDEYQ